MKFCWWNSGTGGSGGGGGLAGNGGNGANGGKIVIHTNDPSVLALIEVDCAGGEGGKPGAHGPPGVGGDGKYNIIDRNYF